MVPEAPVNPKDPEDAVDHLYLPTVRKVPVTRMFFTSIKSGEHPIVFL